MVLSDGAVTTRSCAAYSVAAHLGVGLMVLGGVLLLGYFLVVAVRPQEVPPKDKAVEPSHPEAARPSPVLPPGWYGNPGNPAKPVQWWDGTRLTDAAAWPGGVIPAPTGCRCLDQGPEPDGTRVGHRLDTALRS